jgi:hypothetical protein
MARLYPPERGGIPIGDASRAGSAKGARLRPAVGGASWVARFVRQRLVEVGFAIAILIGIALPFEKLGQMLLLSGVGRSEPVTLEVRDLARGSFRAYDGKNSRLYIVRTADDDVRAFTLPMRGGKVEMPAAQWGRSAYDCSDFGPASSSGALAASGVFQCRDRDTPSWGAARWRWNYDGSPAPLVDDTYIDALPRVTSQHTGGLIRIYRWDILW